MKDNCSCNPPKALEIKCPGEVILFRKVSLPASIGDDTTYPPRPGLYRNVLLQYEANNHVYMFDSGGMPTFISDGGEGTIDYEALINKPSINGYELIGDATLEDIGVDEAIDDAIDDALVDYTPTADLAEVALSGDYDDLTNKPFIPTKTSDLTNDSDFVSDANYVHTDNNFTDALESKLEGIEAGAEVNVQSDWAIADDSSDAFIKNKPTIPVVNNATLTIKRNNTSVGTFTANSATDTDINITVPVTAADVHALPDSTKYGASLVMSIDTTDYKITTTLKDQDGNTLGTAQVIDLPLESVVVNGSYDSVNKKIILTLQNGNTIDIPVGDLISGLQTEITPTNMLSADLVDDTSTTHKFTTAADISKLAGIEAGAEVNVQSDWNQTTTTADDYIKNKPTNVSAFTNDAGYITSASLPTKTSDLVNDGADNTSTYVEADELATVATSGSYNDLLNKPTIPAAQVNSDWNASSGVSEILNKPNLAAVATSGSYNDLSNKPTIPTVNNATLTIQKNGADIQTFTANQATNATANITVPTATSDLTNDSGYITNADLPTKTSDLTNDGSDGTAAYLETDETAYKTASIPYGQCDSTSTSTVYTATIPGITELRDGVCMWLKNGVVNSAANFTININNLGAKPVYSNMAAATRDTTLWNANYTMLFVYDSTRVEGGCWILYRGYNSDNNTIGYQLRTNSTALTTTDRTRYYRLLFTSADGTQWVPANTQYDNSATSNKTINQRKINPFGRIVYLGNSTSYVAGATVTATAVWGQYAFNLGYSFSKGSALTMTYPKPVYVKAAPQSDGSAIIDSATPYVQDLPSTDDGKIYIYLGVAYSATNVEMVINHPIYYYKDGAIREWSNAPAAIASVAWGDITGTLSDQTDLNTALGAKANSSDLATVATSGSYNDLTNKPTIPAAQVNSDWNASSGVAQILNKPTLATVATSGSYNDLSNKPTIPTVNDATLTIQRNSTNVGTFTANASSNKTINIEVPTYTAGSGIDITNNVISTTANTFASYSNGTLYITNAAQNADTENF